jgi:TatD DNase family protein
MMIDTHCHIHDEKFDADRSEVLKRAKDAGVTHMIAIGCDVETTIRAQAQAHQNAQVYFSAGFHPHEAKFLGDDELALIKTMAKDPKCVAIGECGLDFYYEHSHKEAQVDAFVKQIKLASDLGKPLVIHLRDAYDECIEILINYRKSHQNLVIHCFSGTLGQAKEFVRMGAMISLSGIITFKKPGDLIEVAKTIALESLLIETDCPYLAPHPHRGQRNEPAYLAYTLKVVAQARNVEEAVIAQKLYENSRNFFNLA